MSIKDLLTLWFGRGNRLDSGYYSGYQGLLGCEPVERQNFADLLWLNICDLLLDINSDVVWQLRGGDSELFYNYKACFERDARLVEFQLLTHGVVIFGLFGNMVRVLRPDEYDVQSDGRVGQIVPKDSRVRVVVLMSDTKRMTGLSDRAMCAGHLRFFDNVMNSSNTVCERLGSVVIASPQNAPQLPRVPILDPEQKKDIEEQITRDYGALKKQSNFMMLPRPMDFHVLNLAGLDQRTVEKARLAVLAICDRLKVPANQVALIDANSSKSLSNGSELREGDKLKYKSFRRLLNATWWQLAEQLGLMVDYMIENEPVYNEEKSNQ